VTSNLPEPVRVGQQPDRDEEGALQRFGYKQELRRAITPFEMFGVSFSTTSITTGLFLMVGPTLTTAGPLGLWLVLITALPTFAVVATYAAMARRVPVAGLEYQWGMRIAGRAGGLIAGWLGFAAALIAVIAVAYVLASTVLPALFSYQSSATADTWTTIGVVAALTVILEGYSKPHVIAKKKSPRAASNASQ
jgi:amino acid transporter